MTMPTAILNILSLDVGERRIGAAMGNTLAGLGRALSTLENNDSIWRQLQELVKAEDISLIVVGLPRGLDGQETLQTKYVRDFAKSLKKHIDLPIEFQDEALTSHKAEDELINRKQSGSKSDVDALAAVYILEDYFSDKRAKEAVNG